MSFTIPGVDADVSLNLPWKKYLPKVTIDNGGFITVSIGSDLFAEKLEGSKVAWQSQDMKDLQQAQKNAEKEGGFANHLAQMGAAYDYYKTEGWKFMGESKLEVGWFVLLSGRKDVDEDASKSERGMIKARLATGILLKYSYSWTILHMLGPVPLYVSFTLGVKAGFAVSPAAGFRPRRLAAELLHGAAGRQQTCRRFDAGTLHVGNDGHTRFLQERQQPQGGAPTLADTHQRHTHATQRFGAQTTHGTLTRRTGRNWGQEKVIHRSELSLSAQRYVFLPEFIACGQKTFGWKP